MGGTTALVIGGTGFVGRHTVAELLDHGYTVTALSRGSHDFRFADQLAVEHIAGDRTDDETLVEVRERADPDVVIDCAAYHRSNFQ